MPETPRVSPPPGWRFELVHDPARPDDDQILVTDPQALGPIRLLLKDPQTIHRSFYRLALAVMDGAESCGGPVIRARP